jgi:phosphatidylinositol alpha-mannosyltransferase
MRIALLHPFSWPEVRRGAERYAHDLAWWLAGAGHDVDYVTGATPRGGSQVVTLNPRAAGSGEARLVRVAHRHPRRLDARGVTKLDTFGLAALPWLARHRYDVVHALVPAAAIAARLTRHRVVYTAIGHPIGLAEPGRHKDRWLFRRAVSSAHVTTALSASAADATQDLAGHHLRVLPPGIRLDIFTPSTAPRLGPPRLLFPADASDPRKRLGVLIEAMPAVLGALPETRLCIAGPGRLPAGGDPRVAAAIDVLGVGAVEEVAGRYRDATATVLPSVDEAFGLVLAESLACGTPVVGSDSGGIPEVVSTQTGLLVAPDRPSDLARAIIEVVSLAADPATPVRCAEHARQWGWDSIGPRHLAAYDDAIRVARA